jgi:hypothetical protein
MHGRTKRGFDSFIIGAAWALWKQRNTRVFNNIAKQMTPSQLTIQILDDIAE